MSTTEISTLTDAATLLTQIETDLAYLEDEVKTKRKARDAARKTIADLSGLRVDDSDKKTRRPKGEVEYAVTSYLSAFQADTAGARIGDIARVAKTSYTHTCIVLRKLAEEGRVRKVSSGHYVTA
jgi:hypothetical protein